LNLTKYSRLWKIIFPFYKQPRCKGLRSNMSAYQCQLLLPQNLNLNFKTVLPKNTTSLYHRITLSTGQHITPSLHPTKIPVHGKKRSVQGKYNYLGSAEKLNYPNFLKPAQIVIRAGFLVLGIPE
jgi:hypothetical protein